MPPKKTVPKLEDLCYSNIANGLVSLITSWRKTQYCWPFVRTYETKVQAPVENDKKPKELQDYLAMKLPPKLGEKILENTLILICKSISTLNLYGDHVDYLLINIKFYVKFTFKFLLAKGITYLDLTPIAHLITKTEGVHIYENMYSPSHDLFTSLLEGSDIYLKTLKYLKLPHFVYDAFVTLVSERCTELEHLILSCSSDCRTPRQRWDNYPVGETIIYLYAFDEENYSDEEMEQYDSDEEMENSLDGRRSKMGCKKLKQLILPINLADNIDEEIYEHGEKFMNCMKDLEYLKGVPMLHFAYMYGYNMGEEEEIPKIKLRNFQHGAHNNLEGTEFYHAEPCTAQHFSMFTEINEISVHATAHDTEVVLNCLKAFPHVQTVALSTNQFNMHGPYLNNLINLDINIGHQDEWPILNHIDTSSPRLEHLTLRSFSLHVKGNGILLTSLKLPELKTLKLLGQSFIHPNSLYKCLSGCPSLTSLTISILKNDEEELENVMNDSVMLSVIPLLPNLQKFSFKLICSLPEPLPREKIIPWLTITTLNALVEHCPTLNVIEQLDSWNISKTNLDNFYLKCKENNWDLEIN